MSISQNTVQAPVGSILGWLGFGKTQAAASGDLSDPVAERLARARLMANISGFLEVNDLAISAENLTLAHRAFSGIDPYLAHRISTLSASGIPITQDWLNEFIDSADEGVSGDDLKRLMAIFEADIDNFSNTAKEAHAVSASYGAELARHATDLDKIENCGTTVASLARLTQAMLARTRRVEEEMRRSKSEANALRQSLDQARHDAEIDHLTGLPNRRAFEALLQLHLEEAVAKGEQLSVAFCDVDHFKRVNDTHGHDTGDRVLRAIAEALAKMTNDKCHAARHGGEEFVMLFRGQSPDHARARLDEVRERLAARNFVNRKTDKPLGLITFSAGVADVLGYSDPRLALAAADAALYRAKSEGRNQIVIAEISSDDMHA